MMIIMMIILMIIMMIIMMIIRSKKHFFPEVTGDRRGTLPFNGLALRAGFRAPPGHFFPPVLKVTETILGVSGDGF